MAARLRQAIGSAFRLGVLIILATVLLSPADAAARKRGAIVVHANSGQVMHECDADETVFPASLTKLMTLFLTFEALDAGSMTLEQPMVVSRKAARQPRVKLGLRRGDLILVEQAIPALVARSANDVATVVAEAIGGTEAAFAHLMTRRAHALGMKQTLFRNASGLPNGEQVTSARDMARLAHAIWLTFPKYYAYFAIRKFSFNGEDFESHNHLLESYDGADGLKTGYTRASGFNLVSSALRDGQRLIGVVIGSRSVKDRDSYMQKILDYGFRRLENPASALQVPSCKFK